MISRRTPLLLALVLVWPGCLEPSTPSCGNLVCPVEKVCDAHRMGCVLPGQVSACQGKATGEPCSFPGEPRGSCDEEVCYPVACGNGIREEGEVCDDGNQVSGDGCSKDCLSTEVCGNGYVDTTPRGNAKGEECDDRGAGSHDGCSSQCTAEQLGWRELSIGNDVGVTEVRLAYDSARDRTVSFGGLGPAGELLGVTRELDGDQWITISPDVSPSARSGHVLVYDAKRRRVVMFGGGNGTTRSADTWVYDGRNWSPQTSAAAPSARTEAAAAFDAERGRVVLFGGDADDGLNGQTWELDADGWTMRAVAGPSPRRRHVMAYDAGRKRVVLFGGRDGTGDLVDTWEWDGAAWAPITTATTPSARGAMAYDANKQRVVLFGGDSTTDESTWAYGGLDWSLVATATHPAARLGAGLVYDAGRGRVITYGGGIGAIGFAYGDVWSLEDSGWSELVLTAMPPRRDSAAVAYDELRRRIVVHSGFIPPNTLRDDTWSFDGSRWVEEHPRGAPLGGMCPMGPCPVGMVYDSARGRMIFLRLGGPNMPLETWTYDGVSFTKLNLPSAPVTRWDAGLAYDVARDRVVLFGGALGMSGLFGDTWELDGDTWIQRTDVGGPSPRGRPAMAYDPDRHKIVLFGGATGGGAVSDELWEYDGVAWRAVSVASRPPARRGGWLVYHAARRRMMLYGGEVSMTGPLADLWEYDGEQQVFTSLAVAGGPGPRVDVMAYDPVRRVIFVYGGDAGPGKTWELAYRSAVADEVCDDGVDSDGDGLVDCADPDCDGARCGANGHVCANQACACSATQERRCGDGLDDDCDGALDCADPDCASATLCTAEALCANGSDDDADGYTDCADPGCAGVGLCQAFESSCGDGQDNDGDGKVDCLDLDCFLTSCAEVK